MTSTPASSPPGKGSPGSGRPGRGRRSPLNWLLRAYLLLLLISWVVWALRPESTVDPSAWMEVRELPAFTAEGPPARSDPGDDAAARGAGRETPSLRISYDDVGSGPTTVVWLHGSPGSHSDFDALREQLPREWRSIAVDLPGFGYTSGEVPDYSIRAHARTVDALLDELGVERAHFVGFSMGGGVALELHALQPSRCASLTLLASIGVQELELFGSYDLNHAVHVMQLGALHAARWLLPHFGTFDGQMLNIAYARNFHDTDQRPLRGILEEFEPPLLVLHGERDFLVPLAAAEEHARIVPQARLVVLDGSHFLPWLQTAEVARELASFLGEVEAGTAPRRAQATSPRLLRAAETWEEQDVPAFEGPTLLVAFFLLMVATLVSEDLTCVGAGLLVAQGRMGFLPASLACFLGILVGDVLLYLAGRIFGRPALGYPPLRWMIGPEQVERASQWFDRQGGKVIILSRFTPGLRLPTYFSAGVLRTRLATFLLFFTLAGMVWTPALVGLASWIGLEALDLFHGYALPAFLSLVALVIALRKLVLPLLGTRSRKLWVGALRRRLRWEFWPRSLVYPPVILHVLWLGLRHGGLRTACAANPGIFLGGLAGESKSAILDGLGGPDREHIAPYRRLPDRAPLEQRREVVHAFLEEVGTGFPVVVKPDVGERGEGVHVVHDEAGLDAALTELTGSAIVQRFVPGPELGVFWLRRPGAVRGEIFSVTRKVLPTLEGDGVRTLEQLILADRRAVMLAEAYFEASSERLQEVPARGEEVRLVELGTHCRGAIFLDGRSDLPDAAAEAIEELSSSFEGFHLGRYDLRIHDLEAFQRGSGFQVLELNGITAEPAHIYDPEVGVLEAYRTLFEQWRVAFQLGRANLEAGARRSTWREIWRGLRRHGSDPS